MILVALFTRSETSTLDDGGCIPNRIPAALLTRSAIFTTGGTIVGMVSVSVLVAELTSGVMSVWLPKIEIPAMNAILS